MEPEDILKEIGYDSFREGQLEAIQKVMDGKSLLAVFPTGYGKSLIYRVLSKILNGETIIISPLISLMKDQVDFTRKFDAQWGTFINSSLEPQERRNRLWDVANGRYRMVYIAPERLRTAEFAALMDYLSPELLVVDEAHCVTMWGHDFRPDYLFIKRVRSRFKRFLALTATASPSMAPEIIRDLGGGLEFFNPVPMVRRNFSIRFVNAPTIMDKFRLLRDVLNGKHYASGIIYVATRQEADLVADFLKEQGLPADSYHAGLGPETRSKRQERFMSGDVKFMVATSAFGMGIDKPDVELVLHWNVPESIEAYYQEIGRGGRDGREVDAIMFVSWPDILKRQAMMSSGIPEARVVFNALKWVRQNGKWFGDEFVFDPLELAGDMDITLQEIRLIMSIASSIGMIEWLEHVSSGLTLSENGHTREFRPVEEAVLKGGSPFQLERELWLAHFENDLDLRHSGAPLYRGKWLEYVPVNKIEEFVSELRDKKREAIHEVVKMIGTSGCRLVYLQRYFDKKDSGKCGKCDICTGETAPIRDREKITAIKSFLSVPENISRFKDEILSSMLFFRYNGSRTYKFVIFPQESRDGNLEISRDVPAPSYRHRTSGESRITLRSKGKIALHLNRSHIAEIGQVGLSPVTVEIPQVGLDTDIFTDKELTITTQFRPSVEPRGALAKIFLKSGYVPGYVRGKILRVNRPIESDIIDFLRRPHPTELGGRHFRGYALDYKYTFTPDGKRFSHTFLRIAALRKCKNAWNRTYFAKLVEEILAKFGRNITLVPVSRRGDLSTSCDAVELIVESLLKHRSLSVKFPDKLKKGDNAVLIFDEFRDSGKDISFIEHVYRLTGQPVGVIAVVYCR